MKFPIVALAASVAIVGAAWATKQANRGHCPQFTPIKGKVLIAHAGGGLPTAIYTNSIEAMDLAYSHGIRLIELDFHRIGGKLFLGHVLSDIPPRFTTSAEILDWVARHPDALIVTDFKTDNVEGLSQLAAEAGPLKANLIPQIYHRFEYEPVRALGMQKPIFTMYKLDAPDKAFANAADLSFVTTNRLAWARGINKPVLIHTVNWKAPWPVAGFYTDCLVPA